MATLASSSALMLPAASLDSSARMALTISPAAVCSMKIARRWSGGSWKISSAKTPTLNSQSFIHFKRRWKPSSLLS